MSDVALHITADEVVRHDRQRELGTAGDRDLVAVFARAFPRHGVVLDAGGGSGVAVAPLRAAELMPILIDLSPAMLAASRSRTVPTVCADLRRLPVRSAGVDGVHAAYVLPNIAEWRGVAAEFARVLRPGGVALIALGATPPDLSIRGLSRRHYAALVDHGATRVGMPAEATGLRSLDDARSAFRLLGLEPAGEHEVLGVQTRTVRELVTQWSRNPFTVTASAEAIAAAEASTLAWAEKEMGDLDRRFAVRVRHVLHEFRRAEPTHAVHRHLS